MSKLFELFKSFILAPKIILWIVVLVISVSTAEIIYYSSISNENSEIVTKKQKAVSLIQLPDLAVVNEVVWIRHRSISNVFSIFPEDGALLDYYPASFVYSPNSNQHYK